MGRLVGRGVESRSLLRHLTLLPERCGSGAMLPLPSPLLLEVDFLPISSARN